MPEQQNFESFLKSKGLPDSQVASIVSTVRNNPELMAKYQPRVYDKSKPFSSYPEYQPLSPFEDAKNRIINGSISTLQGMLNIVPSAVNIVAPEDSAIHKAMSGFIDSVSSWDKAETEQGKDDYSFVENPSLSNLVRGMGDLAGFIVPIMAVGGMAGAAGKMAGYATKLAQAEKATGILPQILGYNSASRLPSLTAFYGQFLQGSMDQLKAAGITGKNFDYMAPAMAATGLVTAEVAFKGISTMMNPWVKQQLAKDAIAAAVKQTEKDFGGAKLGNLAFADYSKKLFGNIKEAVAQRAKQAAVTGVRGAANLGGFTALNEAATTLGMNIYDNYHQDLPVGEGRFGAHGLGSKEQLTDLFKNTMFGALSGFLLEGGIGVFHPMQYDSMYQLTERAVRTGDRSQIDKIMAKVNDGVLKGRLSAEQAGNIKKNTALLEDMMIKFNAEFPDKYVKDPAARKQLFDLYQQRSAFTEMKKSLDAISQVEAQPVDPIIQKEILSGDLEKQHRYLDQQLVTVNDAMTEIVKNGAFKNEQTILTRLMDNWAKANPEQRAKRIRSDAEIAADKIASDNGYKSWKHLVHSYNTHVAEPSGEAALPVSIESVNDVMAKKAREASDKANGKSPEAEPADPLDEMFGPKQEAKPVTNDTEKLKGTDKTRPVQEPRAETASALKDQVEGKRGEVAALKQGVDAKVAELKEQWKKTPKKDRTHKTQKEFVAASLKKTKEAKALAKSERELKKLEKQLKDEGQEHTTTGDPKLDQNIRDQALAGSDDQAAKNLQGATEIVEREAKDVESELGKGEDAGKENRPDTERTEPEGGITGSEKKLDESEQSSKPVEQRRSAERRAAPEFFQRMIDKLKQAFPGAAITTDRAQWNEAKARNGISGDPVAFVGKDGTVHFNMDKVREDTPMEEFGHLWTELIKVRNPERLQDGLDLVKESQELMDEVARDYPDLDEAGRQKEALGKAIAREGTDIFRGSKDERGLLQKFTEWLRKMWDDVASWMNDNIGTSFTRSEEVAKMKLKDFVRAAAKEMLGGKELTSKTGEQIRREAMESVPMEQRDRDADGVFYDPYKINKNNRRIYDKMNDPIGRDEVVDQVKNDSGIDLSSVDSKNITALIGWANSQDMDMSAVRIPKKTTEELVKAMRSNPQAAAIISANKGYTLFSEAMYNELKNGIWAKNPHHFTQLQKDIYSMMSILKNTMQSPGLQQLIGMENPRSFSYSTDEFGTPNLFEGEAPLVIRPWHEVQKTLWNRIRTIRSDVTKAGGADADSAVKIVSDFKKRVRAAYENDVNLAKQHLNNISENYMFDTIELITEQNVLNLMAHAKDSSIPLTAETSEMLNRVTKMEQMAERRIQRGQEYVTTTGTVLDKTEVDAKSMDNVIDAEAKRNNTLENSMIGKAALPILDALGLRGVAGKAHEAIKSIGIKPWNIETVGVKLFGNENSEYYKLFIRPLIEAQRNKLMIAGPIKDEIISLWHDMRRMSTFMNRDSIQNVKSEKFSTTNGEEHNVTVAELIHIYGMMKQRGWFDVHADLWEPDPSGTLQRNIGPGLTYTTYDANGREIERSMHFDETDFQTIENIINSNPMYREAYEASRRAFDKALPELSRFYASRTGADMPFVKDYVPTAVSRQGEGLDVIFQRFAEDLNPVKSRSMINAPSRAMDIFEVVNRYADDVATYMSYSEPLDNMTKWIYTNGENLRTRGFGQEIDYLKKYVKDMNDTRGTMVDDSVAFNKLLANIGASRLLFNFSPILKQPISYAIASPFIEPKYLRKYMPDLISTNLKGWFKWKNGEGAEDVLLFWKKYSPMLYDRFMGNFGNLPSEVTTVGQLNPMAAENIYSKDVRGNISRVLDYIKRKGLNGIQIADTANNVAIQKAVFDFIADRNPHLQRGSEEFNIKAARYAEEIVRKTQHGYDPATKTALQRSKSPVMKAVFLFTGQLQKQHNLLVQSYLKYLYEPSGSNWASLRANMINIGILNSYWVAAVTIMNATVSGHRKKDDDESLVNQLVLESTRESMANFPIMNVFGTMLLSRIDKQNWQRDLTLPQFDVINEAAGGMADFYKGVYGDDAKQAENLRKGVDATVRTSIQSLGLPYKIYDMMVPKSGK